MLPLALLCTVAAAAPPPLLGHRQQLARRRGASDAAGDLTTQRWVGAQSGDGVEVKEMSCTFRVPEDADIETMPEKGRGMAHYIYCDLHHQWPGGVFGQYVPQLQRGMTTAAANSTTYKLQDLWLDGWYVQAQYIWSTPTPDSDVLGAVGELIAVSPGDTISTRIHYDGSLGSWELAIGAAPDPARPELLAPESTSTLSVTTPYELPPHIYLPETPLAQLLPRLRRPLCRRFFGTNPRFAAPFLGNTSCADYHQFILGDLHEACEDPCTLLYGSLLRSVWRSKTLSATAADLPPQSDARAVACCRREHEQA